MGGRGSGRHSQKKKNGALPEKPWERLEKETDPAWQAFCAYRDLGPNRSTAKAARLVGKSKKLMDGWSSKHEWVRRVRAWEDLIDKQKREAQLDEVGKMQRRHIQLAMNMQGLAATELKKLVDKAQASNKKTLNVDQVAREMQSAGTPRQRQRRNDDRRRWSTNVDNR